MNNWHFYRPALAQKYLQLFKLGLTSARGLFARRRMGKTEFLKYDLMPAAEKEGYVTVYVNLWDLETDPATAIIVELYKSIAPIGIKKVFKSFKLPFGKIKATGKVPLVGEASIEADLKKRNRLTGSLLMEAMTAFDQTKLKLILLIDEAQVLAYQENSIFAHALRAALDVRKDRIKVIFAGSSESTLRKMFGVSSEPFYNWAPLEPFELLGEEFVIALVNEVNQVTQYPLSVKEAVDAFAELKNTPEFFRRYIEEYLVNSKLGTAAALEVTKSKVFSEDGFKQQWDNLLVADQMILLMLANGVSDLYSKAVIRDLGQKLGVGDQINKGVMQNALRRLHNKNILTKIEHGVYQFEDEAFLDWIKHE